MRLPGIARIAKPRIAYSSSGNMFFFVLNATTTFGIANGLHYRIVYIVFREPLYAVYGLSQHFNVYYALLQIASLRS